MTELTLDEQLTKYLTDAHSIEEQAIAQLKLAPRMAGGPELSQIYADHERETEDHEKDLGKYLRDAHALEAQALQLLESGPKLAGFDALRAVFAEHLSQTREHQRMIDERLAAHHARPSHFQVGAMRFSALNLG